MSRVRILLDECIDRRLAREFPDRTVRTAVEAGWSGLENGRLLKSAQQEFDVLLTVDRNLSFQQNLPSYSIAVIVLCARTNRLQDLAPLVPEVLACLANLEPGVPVFVPCGSA